MLVVLDLSWRKPGHVDVKSYALGSSLDDLIVLSSSLCKREGKDNAQDLEESDGKTSQAKRSDQFEKSVDDVLSTSSLKGSSLLLRRGCREASIEVSIE